MIDLPAACEFAWKLHLMSLKVGCGARQAERRGGFEPGLKEPMKQRSWNINQEGKHVFILRCIVHMHTQRGIPRLTACDFDCTPPFPALPADFKSWCGLWFRSACANIIPLWGPRLEFRQQGCKPPAKCLTGTLSSASGQADAPSPPERSVPA